MSKRSTYRTDQKDFEKYFGDAMSEKERHSFESGALEDAFEAEALDGWEEVPIETARTDMAELRNRLHSKGRNFSWMKIAAAIALIMVACMAVWNNVRHSPEVLAETKTEEPSAQNASQNAPQAPEMEQKEEIEPPVPEDLASDSELINRNLVSTIKSNVPDTDLFKSRSASPTLQGKSRIADENTMADLVAELQIAEPEVESPVQVLAVEDQTLKAVRLRPETKALGKVYQEFTDIGDNDDLWAFRQIQGNVYDDNGQIISDARILLNGTSILAVSDFNGKFEMAIPDSLTQPTLVFSSAGFNQLRYNINDSDTFDVIMAHEDESDFGNAFLSPRASQGRSVNSNVKTNDNSELVTAEPKGGFKKFEKYLKRNTRKPATAKRVGIKGVVLLLVHINPAGELIDIKIDKGLGSGCDEEAIRVVRDGPDWLPARLGDKGVESQVLVEVKFD